MSVTRITKSELRELGRRGKLPADFALSLKPPKKKKRSQAEWLDIYLRPLPRPSMAPAEKIKQRKLFEQHDDVEISLRLPLSPALNHYYRKARLPNGVEVVYISAQGKAYKQAVAKIWCNANKIWNPEPLTGRLRILVVCCMARAGINDLDGRWKALLDALEEAGVYENDSQIDDEHMIRGPVSPPWGFVDVQIETIS